MFKIGGPKSAIFKVFYQGLAGSKCIFAHVQLTQHYALQLLLLLLLTITITTITTTITTTTTTITTTTTTAEAFFGRRTILVLQ